MHLRSIHHVLASDTCAHVAKADILLFQDDFDSFSSIAGLSSSGVDYRRIYQLSIDYYYFFTLLNFCLKYKTL
jgi:hypothetical protein